MRHFIKLLPKERQIQKNFDQMDSHQLHAQLPSEFKATRGQHLDLSHYFAFSFVRHPYDRLVSAYNDKILSRNDKGYHRIVIDIKRQRYKWLRFPTQKCMCDNYVSQWWVEFNNEMSWLFTKRFRAFFLSYFQKIDKSFLKSLLFPFS